MIFLAILIGGMFATNMTQLQHRVELCENVESKRCEKLIKLKEYASKKPQDRLIQGVK